MQILAIVILILLVLWFLHETGGVGNFAKDTADDAMGCGIVAIAWIVIGAIVIGVFLLLLAAVGVFN